MAKDAAGKVVTAGLFVGCVYGWALLVYAFVRWAIHTPRAPLGWWLLGLFAIGALYGLYFFTSAGGRTLRT